MQMHPVWDYNSQKNSLSTSPCKCTQCGILTVRKIAYPHLHANAPTDPVWDSYSQKNSLSISPCKCTQCAILTVRKIAHVMTFFNFVFLNTSWNKVNPLQTDGLNTEGTCVQPVAIQESGLGPVKQISALQCTVYEKTGFFLSLSFLLSLSYSCLSKCSV